MARYSNKRFRVARRLEHMIVEYNGRMMNVSDTVLLEGGRCPCKYVIGGCPRADLIYWREIWLRKIDEAPAVKPDVIECSRDAAPCQLVPALSAWDRKQG